MFNGKINYKWPFSIAMLNYQRVTSRGVLAYLFFLPKQASPGLFDPYFAILSLFEFMDFKTSLGYHIERKTFYFSVGCYIPSHNQQ